MTASGWASVRDSECPRHPQAARRGAAQGEAGRHPLARRLLRRQYDWRDGAGPRDKRPRRTNFWADAPEWPANASKNGPQRYEPNEFGSVEFVRFCELVRRPAIFRRQSAQSPRPGILALGRVLQLSRGHQHHGGPARRRRRPRTRSRCGSGVSATNPGAAAATSSPRTTPSEFRRYSAWVPSYGMNLALHRLRPERRQRRLDSPLFRQGRARRAAGGHLGHCPASLRLERLGRPHH